MPWWHICAHHLSQHNLRPAKCRHGVSVLGHCGRVCLDVLAVWPIPPVPPPFLIALIAISTRSFPNFPRDTTPLARPHSLRTTGSACCRALRDCLSRESRSCVASFFLRCSSPDAPHALPDIMTTGGRLCIASVCAIYSRHTVRVAPAFCRASLSRSHSSCTRLWPAISYSPLRLRCVPPSACYLPVLTLEVTNADAVQPKERKTHQYRVTPRALSPPLTYGRYRSRPLARLAGTCSHKHPFGLLGPSRALSPPLLRSKAGAHRPAPAAYLDHSRTASPHAYGATNNPEACQGN